MDQCVLLSGGTVLDLARAGLRAYVGQSLVVGTDRAVAIQPDVLGQEAPDLGAHFNVEFTAGHTTFAAKEAVFSLPELESKTGSPSLVVYPHPSFRRSYLAFLNPFAEKDGKPATAALLAYGDEFAPRPRRALLAGGGERLRPEAARLRGRGGRRRQAGAAERVADLHDLGCRCLGFGGGEAGPRRAPEGDAQLAEVGAGPPRSASPPDPDGEAGGRPRRGFKRRGSRSDNLRSRKRLEIPMQPTAVLLLALSRAADPALHAGKYFKITVVDEQTGRGVPLVELRTVNDIRLLTDSNGVVGLLRAGADGPDRLLPRHQPWLRVPQGRLRLPRPGAGGDGGRRRS